jgi:hypothetical protein
MVRLVCASVLAACAIASGGCLQFREIGSDGRLIATNLDGSREFIPDYVTAAYMYRDENSADLYFSEFPEEWFTGSGGKAGVAPGSILHVHFFLSPVAGSTPIDVTACNALFLNLILTGEKSPRERDQEGADAAQPRRVGMPEMGLYAGGGFLFPDGDPGDEEFGGGIDRASHRLSRSTPGFVDLLGTGMLTGRISAPLNEGLAKAMRARLDELVGMLPPVVIEKDGAKKHDEGEE